MSESNFYYVNSEPWRSVQESDMSNSENINRNVKADNFGEMKTPIRGMGPESSDGAVVPAAPYKMRPKTMLEETSKGSSRSAIRSDIGGSRGSTKQARKQPTCVLVEISFPNHTTICANVPVDDSSFDTIVGLIKDKFAALPVITCSVGEMRYKIGRNSQFLCALAAAKEIFTGPPSHFMLTLTVTEATSTSTSTSTSTIMGGGGGGGNVGALQRSAVDNSNAKTPRDSGGGPQNFANALAMAIVDHNSRYDIFYHSVRTSDKAALALKIQDGTAFLDALKTSAVVGAECDLHLMCRCLELVKVEDPSMHFSFCYDNLAKLGESKYQDELNKRLKGNRRYVPKSDSTPNFMFKLWEEELAKTAKPDLVSTVLPLMWEFKTAKEEEQPVKLSPVEKTYELLLQTLERVDCMVRMNEALANVYAFALTGRGGYLIRYSRSDDKYDWIRRKKTGSFHVHYLGRNASVVNTLTSCLVSQVESYHKMGYLPSYLSGDAPIIFKTLTEMGLCPALCRIKLVGSSLTRVYAVTKCNHNNGPKISLHHMDFAIKIIDRDSNPNEVHFSKLVAEESHKVDRFCYLLGCCTTVAGLEWWGNVPAFVGKENDNQLPNVWIDDDESVPAWWLRSPFLKDSQEALVMMVGEYKHRVKANNLDKVAPEVMECLLFYQSLGINHRDIRAPNIVLFGDRYQLIDFGMAAKASTLTCINDYHFHDCGYAVVAEAKRLGTATQSQTSDRTIINDAMNCKVTLPRDPRSGHERCALCDYMWRNGDDLDMFAAMIKDVLKEEKEKQKK